MSVYDGKLSCIEVIRGNEREMYWRRALRQRQSRFPVLLLSTGGTCWHADERRMSIAAAISFALEAGLQGLVLDSGAVQQQQPAIAAARSKGLKV